MELKEGMYVRTDNGLKLGKVIEIHKLTTKTWYELDTRIRLDNSELTKKKIKDNIIDLIEVGDYVNGERVIALKKDISERNIHMNSKGNSIFVDYDLANDWYYGIDDEDIKSIVTKEQFESMEYKVNE